MMGGYVTVTEADERIATLLLSNDPQRSAWQGLSDGDKAVYLSMALARLESLVLAGRKAEVGQALQFPRHGQEDVPEQVKEAQVFEACALIGTHEETARRAQLRAQGVSGFTVGSLSETFTGASTSAWGVLGAFASLRAQQLLRPYIAGGVRID